MTRFASRVLTCLFAVVASPEVFAAALPELPRLYVDTTYVPPSGNTIRVRAGESFQAALNRARPGDVITLEAGAIFRGPFILPKKEASGWIIVRSSAESELPPPGTRVRPWHSKAMPKLVAASGPVITAEPGAHHYRIVGIELRPEDGRFLTSLVVLGADETSLSQLSHHIIFDRCYLHGDPKKGTRRGIAMNSRTTAVIDSYLSDFKEVGAEAQALIAWNGPGPFKIVNNYLEAAGENVMFGGADPTIRDLVPSDIEIRKNHFAKPLSWKIGDPGYAGTPWTVKNIFELKNARRVLVDGNLFENNWAHAQNGFAILFTVRNQDGKAPWSTVEDVTFKNNVVRRTTSAINILGRDNNHPSGQTKRILIKNNLFEDIGGRRWGGGGHLFQLLGGTTDLAIVHNTSFQSGAIVVADGEPHHGFVFSNNIALHNEYGFGGTGTFGNPSLTISTYFPKSEMRGNVIVRGSAGHYPSRNFFPASLERVGFVDPARGHYCLAESSRYKRVAERKDPGADLGSLSAALGIELEPPCLLGFSSRPS